MTMSTIEEGTGRRLLSAREKQQLKPSSTECNEPHGSELSATYEVNAKPTPQARDFSKALPQCCAPNLEAPLRDFVALGEEPLRLYDRGDPAWQATNQLQRQRKLEASARTAWQHIEGPCGLI